MAKSSREGSLYLKIKDVIKRQILSGELNEGDRVMSESELCAQFSVSRISARKALDELEREGYINRVVGSGNYVTFPPIEHLLLGLYSLSNEVEKRGMTPSSKLLDFKEMEVTEVNGIDAIELKRKLFLYDYDRVYYIRRLRYADDEIMALDNTYIPVKFCPSITAEDIERIGSLYKIMEERFHCGPTRAQEYFFARAVTAEEAQHLDVNPGSPALKVMRISYAHGNPVEYNYRIYKGEKYHYRVDLQSHII